MSGRVKEIKVSVQLWILKLELQLIPNKLFSGLFVIIKQSESLITFPWSWGTLYERMIKIDAAELKESSFFVSMGQSQQTLQPTFPIMQLDSVSVNPSCMVCIQCLKLHAHAV